MYADKVMGIASGSQYSQDIAKNVIDKVGSVYDPNVSQQKNLERMSKTVSQQQKKYGQTVHEENLVAGKNKNKTQWVSTEINGQFGHQGGTSESKKCGR